MFTQTYTQLPDDFYIPLTPESLPDSDTIHVNQSLLDELGLKDLDIDELVSGESWPKGFEPLAQKYTGHQFGYYNPDLGDGRGLLLGQWVDSSGKHWDFHLKGAGRTPYSRRGDGRAVLRSTIREYLVGEYLHALGIPTTRALALARGNETVFREGPEQRAMLIRVTPSHIRFGHFEWAASQGPSEVRSLLQYVFKYVYPELNTAEELLYEVSRRTAKLIASWQTVGFNHGVMNTDNMSILGETFDFGPYAFFDTFQIGFICNHSDDQGRYAYNEQPNVGLWNVQVLALALADWIPSDAIQQSVEIYTDTYNHEYLERMLAKLGITKQSDEDKLIVRDLLVLMDQHQVDFSLFFSNLTHTDEVPKGLETWHEAYLERIKLENSEDSVKDLMKASNPNVYLRNHIAQQIIEAVEQNDYHVLDAWVKRLQTPIDEHGDVNQEPPQIRKNIRLSCSS